MLIKIILQLENNQFMKIIYRHQTISKKMKKFENKIQKLNLELRK